MRLMKSILSLLAMAVCALSFSACQNTPAPKKECCAAKAGECTPKPGTTSGKKKH